jgi:hypothetical protein
VREETDPNLSKLRELEQEVRAFADKYKNCSGEEYFKA